ncbi:MAG: CHRD domain-containing protein [Gaiellaceae bacterium]
MKRLAAASLAGAALLAVAACGGDEAESLMLQLEEQNGSEQSGTATLTAVDSGMTRIVLALSNPPDVAQPSHVHQGSCDDLGDVVAGLDSLLEGHAETVVDLSLDNLQAGGLVLHAHKSEAESEISVACAPIPAAR